MVGVVSEMTHDESNITGLTHMAKYTQFPFLFFSFFFFFFFCINDDCLVSVINLNQFLPHHYLLPSATKMKGQ